MLLQFLVENHRSFRDETILSMLVPDTVEVPDAWVIPGPRGVRVLRGVAIYGANASGKSNLVDAFRTFRELIVRGTRTDDALPYHPFKLDAAAASAPTRFELEVLLDGQHLSYGLTFDAASVHSEWLYVDGDVLVFDRLRSRSEDGTAPRVTWGPGLERFVGATTTGGDPGFLEYVRIGTRGEQPLLTEAAEKNVTGFQALVRWLRDADTVAPDSRPHWSSVLAGHDAIGSIAQLLARFDTGVTSVRLESIPFHPNKIRGADFGTQDGKTVAIRPRLSHAGASGDVEFDLEDESDGTLRLLELAPLLHGAGPPGPLGRRGMAWIDELDRSLHAVLSRRFIEEFVSANAAQHNSRQLVVTTHDTSLLHRAIMPVVAIRFVEKGRNGASELYALTDFDPEQLSAFTGTLEDGYLSGRFGAIPFVADRERLGWERTGSDG